MTAYLLACLLLTPVISIILLVVVKPHQRRSVLLAELSLLILGTLLLPGTEPFDFVMDAAFLGHPIFLSFSKTPIVLFLALIATLLFLILLNRHEVSLWHGILLSLTLPSGFVAFFSGQFMLRYIALEIVGLACALTAITSARDLKGYRWFAVIFLLLRLGDMGLWSAILLLQDTTGTLEITAMIEAAAALPVMAQILALAGFLFAILFKLAIWPFGVWQYFVPSHEKGWINWIPTFLMPGLGLYLLYRISPIIQAHTALQTGVSLLGLGLALAPLIASTLKWIAFDRFFLFNSLASALAIFIAAYGTGALLRNYFLILITLRLAFRLTETRKTQIQPDKTRTWITSAYFLIGHAALTPLLYPLLPLAVFFVWMGMILIITLWGLNSKKLTAPRPGISWPAWVETGLHKLGSWESAAWELLSGTINKTAGLLYDWVEIGAFSRGFSGAGQALVAIADFLQETVETNLEKLWKVTGQKLVSFSRTTLHVLEDPQGENTMSAERNLMRSLNDHETREDQKSFRWDLIWIPFLLILILFFLFFSQKG